MIKRKIVLILIAVMLVSQLGMGFSYADSEQGKDSVENQNVVGSDILEDEQSNAGNIEKEDIKDIGENKDTDKGKNEQSHDEHENKISGETDVQKTGETDNSDIKKNENIETKGTTEAEKLVQEEKAQTQESTEQIKLLSEEPVQEKSSLESQLEKVTAYYKNLGQDAKLSAPMEGVARFAVGERASLEALKTATQMEAQYHLKHNEINDLKFVNDENSDESSIAILAETTDGLNAQVWLAQMVLDILAAGGDPSDFQGHNYVHELLSSQSAKSGFFTSRGTPGAADGLSLLALNAYWGNAWPKTWKQYGEKSGRDFCLSKISAKVTNIKKSNFAGDKDNFIKGAQWGMTKTYDPITFYNNFWLTQGLSLDVSTQKTNMDTLATALEELPKIDNPFYYSQCETLAASIIARLSAGQSVSKEEWNKLAEFQMEDGQYKRLAGDSSANGEATAMAAIALDYGKRLESDKNAKSAFLTLAEANPEADRTAVSEHEKTVFMDVADLKTSVDSVEALDEIINIIKEKGDTVSFISSNTNIVSPEDKVVHPLEAGEPDAKVQLKVLIKNGNCQTIVNTKVFNLEPEVKIFPFERNIELLKQYYKNYPQDAETKGINKSNQAFAVASLMNDPQLGGISYTTQFYGDGGYFSYHPTFLNPEVSAALDWIAVNKDPKQYIKIFPSTGLTEQVDIINQQLKGQYDNGSFSNPSSTYGYAYQNCVLNALAMESYFGGKDWGNEKNESNYGRIAAIKDILSHMINADQDSLVSNYGGIGEEGGRILYQLDSNDGFSLNNSRDQSFAVILFSRWLNDDTGITVNGETKPLKEFAQKEVEGILKTLKWSFDNESDLAWGGSYETEDYAYYISALVASGHKDKVDEYGLWDKLRNGRAANGSYYSTPAQPKDNEMSYDPATMAVAMAMGDYQNGKSILASMTYDTSILTDAEAVQKDIANIKLPSVATEKISLPVKGYYGSTIVWESSNPDVIDTATGGVVRPTQGQMDAVVALNANIQRGQVSETKSFIIKVPAVVDVNNEKGTADYEALSIPLFVKEDIKLPTTGGKGSSIVWESSNTEAITNEGKVTLGDTDTKVTVKATVTNGTYIKVKEFQVTVSKELTGDVVDGAVAQLRAYYNDNRDLTSSYWDIFAAKSVLGDDFDNYNFKVYDVKSHRASSSWQGTDYGAVVLQILAQGDNPYNYQGENYVEKLQKFVDEKGWGAWGSPIWAAMALDAAGADPQGHKYNRNSIEGFFKSQLGDLQYGPDLAGWALIPMATTMIRNGNSESTEELNTFMSTLKEKQEKTGINKGLFNTGGVDGGSIALSNGCVVSGFMAMQKAGVPDCDLTQDEWKKDSTGVLDTLYNQEVSGKTDVNTQIAIEFGDAYYGDSVWRRVGVKPEQLEEMINKAEPLVTGGDGKYTVKSFDTLKTAYQAALNAKNDPDKMKNYYFGQSYFNLRDAVEGLKEKGTAEITIYGQAGNKILDQASISKVGSSLDVLQEAALENGISITNKDNKIAELGGIKADSKGQWYVYKQTSDGDGVKIMEPLDQYNVEEGTLLVLKYCKDTSKLAENTTLNQHLVYDAAQALKINGAIDSQNEVTGDIVLANSGLFGTSVTWLPNKLFAINENGKVTRDAKEDINVTLTAKIYLNGTSTEKQFTVKVKSLNGDYPVNPTAKKAYISIAGPVGEKWSGKYAKTEIEIESGETAFSLLEKTGASLNVDKNTKYGVYVRGINGLSEFDKGNQSGWMYRVNGQFPGHSAALERIYENDYVEWLYTTNLGRDVGGYVSGVEGSSGTVTGKKNANSVSVTTSVTARTDSTTGEAKVTLNAAEVVKALKELQDKVKSAKVDGKNDIVAELKVDVSTDSQATSVETTIPKLSAASFSDGVDQISIVTAIGEVTFDKDTIKNLTKDVTGDLKVTIAKTDAGSVMAKISGVTNEVKAKVKGRPIYEYTAEKGNKIISELGGKAVSVVPYTLASGEQAEAVVAYWMKPDGSLEIINNGHLSDDSKHFIMENNHWSTYVIGYNEVKFVDTASHWAKKNILYLAARDIIKGKSATAFSPDSQITRAEFVQILANMSGNDLSKYTDSAFSDVSEKAWYAKAVAWAVEKGIAGGTGNEKFSPNANITRQDMSVMISKYAANVSKKSLANTNKAVQFADGYEIASYAKDAVTSMQKASIINGEKNNLGSYSFNPKNNATRAEATTMIANYIKQ